MADLGTWDFSSVMHLIRTGQQGDGGVGMRELWVFGECDTLVEEGTVGREGMTMILMHIVNSIL